MTKPKFKYWDPNVICDICGFKFKMSQCKKTWDGYLACKPNRCWYPKHPFDDPLPVIPDGTPIVNARPEPQDQFVSLSSRSTWKVWVSVTYGTLVDPPWNALLDSWNNY